MKKSLFAVAAVTAFAGAAQAQSSVTVYGILDVGYIGANERVATGSAVKNSTGNSFGGNGAESTSRLGFRGNEDLGGGTSAFFTVEYTLTPNGTNFSSLQNRQSFVGLKKNGIGQVATGTINTMIHNAVGATDPGQQNNMMGNVIYAASSLPGTAVDSTAIASTVNGNTNAYTVRTSNTLAFESAVFAGVKVKGNIVANNNNSTQGTISASTGTYTGGINNQSGWALGADYTWNKLLVTANYQAFSSKNPYGESTYGISATSSTLVATTSGGAAAWTTAAGGTNVKDNQAYVGATYDFGILKAYAGWVNRKVTSQTDATQFANRSAQQLGVRSYITPTIEAWASAGNGRYQQYGASEPTANFTGYQLGSNYWLSKRTNLYAIYGATATSNSSNANVTYNSRTSYSGNNYAVGVRHTF